MAGKVNSFSAVLISAGVLSFMSVVLQTAGLSTDYLQSINFINKQHWGLWYYCYETPLSNKCYSLVFSDKYVHGIITVPSLWKLFQAVHVVGLMLLVLVFILIVPQLCSLQYNRRTIVAAIIISTIAGLLILIGCAVYAGIKSAFYGNSDNSQLEYSFGLLVAAGVMAIICAIILNVARRNFPNDQTLPASDSIAPHHTRNQGTPTPAVISYQRPHHELQHSAYGDGRKYHVTEHKSLPQ